MKVSRPVDNIYNLCYTFAQHHKFFADHTMRHGGDDDNDDQEEANDDVEYDGKHMSINEPEVVEELPRLMERVNLDQPDCASENVEKEREQMMLIAAEHIKMARAQQKLHQDKAEKAKKVSGQASFGPNVHLCC